MTETKQLSKTASAADERVNRMGTESIPKLLLEFAIPAIAGTLVNGAYNIIDSIFLGQAMGEIGLAATTVANPIMTVFIAIAMMVGAGGNAYAALRLGEGRKDQAELSLGNTVTISLILWLLFALAAANDGILNVLLDVSSATDEVRPYAAQFIRIICFGFILQCVGFGVNNFIRTAGAPRRALLSMVVGAVVCVIFNYLFVMVMGLGVAGSAYATLCGQCASCVSVMTYFLCTPSAPFKLYAKNMRPHLHLCINIVTLGLSSFFMQISFAIVNFVTNMLLVMYGALSPIGAENALASIGLVGRVAGFTIMPLAGMSIAAQPLLGFNYGAKLYKRVRLTLRDAVLAATGIGVLMFAVVHIWPDEIVNLFGITEPDMVRYTVFALKVQLLMLPFIGFQIVGSNYFQATGQPLKSSILTLSRQVLFLLPLLFFLPEWLPVWFPQFDGLDALYIATPIADALAIMLVTVFVIKEMRRLKEIETVKAK